MTSLQKTVKLPLNFEIFSNTHKIDSIVIEETDDYQVVEWENVEILNTFHSNDPREITLSGTYFVIQPHLQYYHFMFDSLAVFLFLKKKYPHIKPLVLLKTDSDQYKQDFRCKDILEYCGINHYYYLDKESNSKQNFNIFKLEKAIHINKQPFDMFRIKDIILNLRENIYTEKDININKKIYISRRDSHNRAVTDEKIIEDYFNSLGFQVVVLSELSILQQKELFEDAHTVVGRSGTGFVNLLFMHKEAQIIDLNVDFEYINAEYQNIAKTLDLNYINIFFTSNESESILTKLKDFATLIK